MPAAAPDLALTTFETMFGPEFGHGKSLDLVQLRAALTVLGAPHTRLPPIIHVAGSNGKGSTIAFLRAIAEAAGLRVHVFTKPHLFALSERFVIAGDYADDAVLIEAAMRVASVAPELTQFDAQIAAAFILFSERPADLVLLETGMGGRDDSTNVVTPALSLITAIALDHQDALGATLPEIAAHKAGILKPGVPGITARQSSDAMAVIEAEAARIGAPLWRQGIEWDGYAQAGRLLVQTEQRLLDLPLPNLRGAHQIDNAALAVAALCVGGLSIGEEAMARGLQRARWPARLQALTQGALAQPIVQAGGEVWVDGGHNAHAAAALKRAMADLNARAPRDLVIVLGLRARKDAHAFLTALDPRGARVIAAPLADDHIAPAALAAIAANAGAQAETAPSLRDAMKNAAHSHAPRVLICGSLTLAAEALRN